MITVRTEPVRSGLVAREWAMDYAMVPGSVRLIRMHLRRQLTVMGWHGDLEDAVVIASELASNAVKHAWIAGELLTVRAAVLDDSTLQIDVADPAGVFPGFGEMTYPPADVEGGRGLLLARNLGASLSWFLRESGGKTVRAHLAMRIWP
ncbi:ATP-binding protein [Streptomyces sp. NPDC002018]|uniref:ATP-binding protein n=1 Tax=Streptomyces sp. NPDC002018 TaxID=3364629 RepID=UPI0036A32486